MEIWELVRLLLAGARGIGETFNSGRIAGTYYRQLEASALTVNQTYAEFLEIAEAVTEELEGAGLIRAAQARQGSNVILGAMERTQFGGEVLEALNGRNVVSLFESMQTNIEPGEIRRLLHQLG